MTPSWHTGSVSSLRSRNLRVLLVDDSAALRGVLGRMLDSLGHHVVGEAADAEAGRSLAEQIKPDTVVIDGRLPGTGALDLLGALRAEHPGTHALIVVALNETSLLRAARLAGARAALLRPYTRTHVEATLRSLLEERAAES